MKILIAEDESIEAFALQKILKQHYPQIKQIQICRDGREAVVRADKESFDIIFMDINMPYIDGISAATQIRSKDKKVIIIMLTAYSDFEYAKASIENRVFAYITKPYSVKTLKGVMDKVLSPNAQIPPAKTEMAEIEELILTGDQQSIQKYVDYLWDSVVNAGERDRRQKIFAALKRDILVMTHCVGKREREALIALAEERLLFSDEAEKEVIKADCFYILQRLSVLVHQAMEMNEDDIIIKAKKYINASYNKEIQLNDIADSISISKFYLSRIFKLKTGENIKDYLLKVRLEKAKQLLRNHYNVKEVAYKTGFNNPSYFSKCFKKELNMSPGEYREKLKNSQEY